MALVSYTLHLVVTFVAGARAIVDVTAVVSGPAAVTLSVIIGGTAFDASAAINNGIVVVGGC